MTGTKTSEAADWHVNNGGHFATPHWHALRLLREVVELCLVAGADPKLILDQAVTEIDRQVAKDDYNPLGNMADFPEEFADCQILLDVIAYHAKIDVKKEVFAKMEILRARKWEADSHGCLWRPGMAPVSKSSEREYFTSAVDRRVKSFVPKIKSNQEWCCSKGCGPCEVIESDYEYSRTELPNGERIVKTEVIIVSACCKAQAELWDETVQGFVEYKINGDDKVDLSAKYGKREWAYVLKPDAFAIPPCDCGNNELQWSEFEKHVWCDACQKDYIPSDSGVFGAPVPVQAAKLLGINFDRIILATKEYQKFNVITGTHEKS